MNEKIKINDKIYLGTIKKISLNQIQMIFEKDIPKPEQMQNGFCLVDFKNRVYGDFSNFVTIFKITENGYILSNDESVYVEPEEIDILEPTEEELKEQELQDEIFNKQYEIDNLKSLLQSSDYKIIKAYEYSLVNKPCEYDSIILHDERQQLRDLINEKERELQQLIN